MKHPKLLVIDFETGGLDASIDAALTLGAVVWYEGGIQDELYLKISKGEMNASPEALKVNGINIVEHEAEALSALAAVNSLEAFLCKNDLNRRVYLAGHNIAAFDLAFLKKLYQNAGKDFNTRFSYHTLDTMNLGLALSQVGRLNGAKGVGLEALCNHLKIKLREDGAPHNSLEDARATGRLLTKLLEMVT